MSATSDSSLIVTGKRKRKIISYAEPDNVIDVLSEDGNAAPENETITADSDDEDATFATRKSRKKAPPKKKVKKTPKAKKTSPFRFLDLPPELRGMIYEEALVDPNGVSLVARTKHFRRIASRGAVYHESDYTTSYRWRSKRRTLNSGSEQISPITNHFVPALLAVNKQINSEAINYLYGQDFAFENSAALHQFLATIGPLNQTRLRVVELMSYGTRRGVSCATNLSAFISLAGATNLTALLMSCKIHGGHPDHVSHQLYRDAHHFLEAYGTANGDKLAALDIVQLCDSNFEGHHKYQHPDGYTAMTAEESQQKFDSSLRSLMQSR